MTGIWGLQVIKGHNLDWLGRGIRGSGIERGALVGIFLIGGSERGVDGLSHPRPSASPVDSQLDLYHAVDHTMGESVAFPTV